MSVFQKARMILETIAKRWQSPAFSCGDCERNAQCGRPPTADCAIKLAHLQRDPTGYEQRMKSRYAVLRSGSWA